MRLACLIALPLLLTGCIIEVCDSDSDTDGPDLDPDTDIQDCSEEIATTEVSEDLTITADCITTIPARVVVKNSAVLTIEAGARLEFAADAGIDVAKGRIVIDGTAARPVVLTSGDTKLPGTWGSVSFRADALRGNTVRHAIFEYGGAPESGYADHGVFSLAWVTGYEPDSFLIEDSIFRDNLYGGVGVWSLSGGTVSPGLFSSFSRNTFSNNGGVSIRLPPQVIADVAEDNVIDEPVRVAGKQFYDDRPWPDLGQPYILEDGLRVGDPEAELHVQGLDLRFERRTSLDAEFGALFAKDTQFTSAAKTPAAGDWGGLFIGFRARATFEDCTIEYTGTGDYQTLRFQNDSALYSTITGTTFADNIGSANLQAQEYCSRFTGTEAGNTFDLTPCVR